MANHIRRFVTSPLPIFQFEFTPGTRTPPPLVAAAKCLALCIDVSCAVCFLRFKTDIALQLAPGDDLGMSYMYSLLNHIAATSKEPYDVSVMMKSSMDESADSATLYSIEAGLRGLSEEEKHLVAISTISVVTRLALEFKDEEVGSTLYSKVKVISIDNRLTGYPSYYLHAFATITKRRGHCRGCHSL